MGFGVTTVLLNLHNSGLFPLSSMIISMGIFYGGLAQVIAGIMEYRRGNMFGTTAFTSYGLFWLSLAALIIFPKIGWSDPTNSAAMAAYLAMWGIFTALMSIPASRMNYAILTVFVTLTILFFLLAIGEYIPLVHTIAGLEGIFCGSTAIYTAIAEATNEAYGKAVFPIWQKKKQ